MARCDPLKTPWDLPFDFPLLPLELYGLFKGLLPLLVQFLADFLPSVPCETFILWVAGFMLFDVLGPVLALTFCSTDVIMSFLGPWWNLVLFFLTSVPVL